MHGPGCGGVFGGGVGVIRVCGCVCGVLTRNFPVNR
jgi:hypothetical protein